MPVIRLLLLGTALSATMLLTGVQAQSNGRPPSACSNPGSAPAVSGTRWTGRFTWDGDPAVTQTMRFRPDCVLEYSYNGSTHTNGKWRQSGALVLWDTNDYYAVYMGTRSGGQMSGVMNNQNGDSGVWSFKRAD